MTQIRNNIAPLSAMVAFAVAFLAVYAATKSVLASLLVAAPLALGDFFIILALFPANAALRDYDLDARRRVKKVMDSVGRIQGMAKQVTDAQARKSLADGCEIIPQLLSQTRSQQTMSFKVASTAASVQTYLTSVEAALDVYLRIQKNPEYFANGEANLAQGRQGFADFESFCLKSIQQLNSGDTAGYAANLETLRPLTLPQISAISPPTTPDAAHGAKA